MTQRSRRPGKAARTPWLVSALAAWRWNIALAASFIVCIAGWRLARLDDRPNAASESALSTTHAGLNLERVKSLSSLTILRVDVADAVTARSGGYTGSVTAILLVRGDVTIGVDLQKSRFEQVDPVRRTAVLWLPSPALTSARLDHERTRLLALRQDGLWAIVPGGSEVSSAALNSAYGRAQELVASVGRQSQLIEKARRQTEQVLGEFLSALQWHVRWQWEP